MKKCCVYILILLSSLFSVYGQQTPLISQHHVVPFIFNPSMAGSFGNIQVCLLTRQQWLGYENYPGTYWASIEGRLIKRSYILRNSLFGNKSYKPRRNKSRIGMGLSIANDRNGLLHETSLTLSYAYHIFVNRTQVSMGLGLFVNQLSINEKLIEVVDVNDPKLNKIKENQFYPDFTIGLSLRNYRYTAGLSVVSLMESPVKLGNSLINYTLYRHYNAFFGYKMPLNRNVYFIPRIFGVFTETGQYHLTLMTGLSFSDQYHINIAYRNQSDLILQGGITIPEVIMSNELYIGYAFDYPMFSMIKPNNIGAHELILRIGVGSSTRRDKWIDRY